VPSKLVSIGAHAFCECKALTQFRVVGSVEAIAGDFAEVSGVHHVFVEDDNEYFKVVDGFLMSREGTSIVYYFGEDRDVRIGMDIETVRKSSFARCRFLRSVTFEKGSKLTAIEQFAFRRCRSLERVHFGGSCPSLGFSCFDDCEQLTEVSFESSSERLPARRDAFHGCYRLKLW
jgi:hypothetical protein